MESKKRAHILGMGAAFPEKILTSIELEKSLGLPPGTIFEKTGIRERRVLAPGQEISNVAAEAALNAMSTAGISAKDVDLVLGCTNSPDKWMPGLGATVQTKLHIPPGRAAAYDIVSACTGWLAGLQAADAFIRSGIYKNILVVGSEGFTRFLDWNDPSSCVLFADGAGACVVSGGSAESPGAILDSLLHTDGDTADVLTLSSRDGTLPLGAKIQDTAKELALDMDKEKVFINAIRCMTAACRSILERNQLGIDDVDWLIPHQANIWIINGVGELLNIPKEKVAVNVHKFGNTLAATVPTCLSEYVEAGKIKRGDKLLLTSFGAGATWGAALIEW